MPPGLRKFALTAHLTASVGWIGAVVAYLALGVAAVASRDAQTVRAPAGVTLTWRRVLLLVVAAALVASLATIAAGYLVRRAPGLPPGYTAWRGLPIPDYFERLGEGPSIPPGVPPNSGAPKVCTVATFRHQLNDPGQAWQEMSSAWQKRGLSS